MTKSFIAIKSAARFDRIGLALGRMVQVVILGVAPARDVAPLPFIVLAGDLGRQELSHKVAGIGLRQPVRVHLDVSVELRIGVRVAEIGREIYRCWDGLDLDIDGGALIDVW
jgi:hypothetical protein